MSTIPLFSGLRREIRHPWVLDVLIILGLLLLAWIGYFVTPAFAANLPQDALDFALPAVHWLELGRFVHVVYGHEILVCHPFGTALLLLPSYVVFGHFPGNGVYSIFFCAFGTIALTYVIGAKLGGRLCGGVAALFLITHYGFWQYSQKIMSEVPAAFLATAMLALLLTIREGKRSSLKSVLVGVVLGFAILVRSDSLLLFAPAGILLVWETPWREGLRRASLCVIGMLPFLVSLAVYNQVTFGGPGRNGYQYWGNAGNASQPLFSMEYATKTGFMRLRGIDAQLAPLVDGNGTFYSKSLLGEFDMTRIFGPPGYWQGFGRHFYQVLALLRTALGIVGLLWCLAAWRNDSLRRQFLLWVVVSTIIYGSLYLLYMWQEERYFLRLVPVFCLASAFGVTALLDRWPTKAVRATAIALISALMIAFAFFNMQMGFPNGDDSYLYETLSKAAGWMEPNAVVVTNFDPMRVDPYIVHGTERTAVPLDRNRIISVFVGRDTVRTPMYPFIASESPERLRELVHSGRPVYWLINNPWTGTPSPELDSLRQSFHLQVLATANPDGTAEHPFFGRITELPQED